MAGERQTLLAAHLRRFDEEDVAAVRRVGEAGRDAGLARPLGDLGEEALRTEELAHLLWRDVHALGRALGDGAGDLTADAADLALEVAEARLARVATDDLQDRVLGELDVRVVEAVLPPLLRDEMAPRDLHLLL